MNKEKLIKVVVIFCFFVFIVSYVIEQNGYYEYQMHSQKVMTDKQIKQFEEDIKNGKEVDINDYLKDNYKDYTNKFTDATYQISKNTNKYLKKGIESIFSLVNNLVN